LRGRDVGPAACGGPLEPGAVDGPLGPLCPQGPDQPRPVRRRPPCPAAERAVAAERAPELADDADRVMREVDDRAEFRWPRARLPARQCLLAQQRFCGPTPWVL